MSRGIALFILATQLMVACTGSSRSRLHQDGAPPTTEANPAFQSLKQFPNIPDGEETRTLLLDGEEIDFRIAHFRAKYDPRLSNGFPASEEDIPYFESFSEVSLGRLTPSQHSALINYFEISDPLGHQDIEYRIEHFLPRMMQELTNRVGMAMHLIDCYSVAYARLASPGRAHLIYFTELNDLVRDESKFEKVFFAENVRSKLDELKGQLRFGDLIVLPGHVATVVTPDLVWEKMLGGNVAIHLTTIERSLSHWEKMGSRATVYRAKEGVTFEKFDELSTFHPSFGNTTHHAVKFTSLRDAQGLWSPKTFWLNGNTHVIAGAEANPGLPSGRTGLTASSNQSRPRIKRPQSFLAVNHPAPKELSL